MFKKMICVFISFAIVMSVFPYSVTAMEVNGITAPSAVLMEGETGKILFQKNCHEKRACASITKVMTLLLVMEALKNGKLKTDQMLTSSAHAASMGGSDIWLEEGEQMSVNNLIKATAVASANDAAVVLAEAISGSEESFVAEMNKKAESLGMKETTFKNCNGLDEEGHITSAYDVALMSAELIKYKKIFEYTSIWIDNLRGGKTQIVNTNKLLRTYNGITGLKTGTTGDAGCCMSATAERDGLSLIAVVLGCDNGTDRFADSAKLLDYGFANYSTKKLIVPEKARGTIEVKGGMTDKVQLECSEAGSVVLEKGSDEQIVTKCTFRKNIEAPVKKGDILGKVQYISGNKVIKTCDITAKNQIKAMNFGLVISEIYNSLIAL